MRGALFMVIAMAGFTINDAISKQVTEGMNVGQLMLVRGAFASVLVAALAWSQGAFRELRQLMNPLVAARAFCELTATVLFLFALTHMPLANVSAVLQALPLAVTMGAALFLGEAVGWRRWIAIAVGFSGVMIVVRPGFEGFNAFSLLTLCSVAFAAGRDLVTSRIPDTVPTALVSAVTAVIVTIAGGALVVPLGGWTPMSAGQTLEIGAAAVLLLFGYQFIIMAMRGGDISFVAPFRYTSLLWAILLGYMIFGQVPDLPMMIGATVVIASGLYTLYRERRVSRTKPAAESTGPGMAPDGM